MIEILERELIASGHGTHKYRVKWRADEPYTEEELIDAVDGTTGNYGGRVKTQACACGTYWGTVCVYYD